MTDTKAERKFPEVQGGGSLIVAWQIKGKNVVVVGGGEVRFVYFLTKRLHIHNPRSQRRTDDSPLRSPPAVSSIASTPTPA